MTAPDGTRLDSALIGALGERLAAKWLWRQRWKILWKNYRAETGGESDLVCRDRDTLVFVEVKTRTSREFGNPADAVDDAKEALLLRAAMDWLRRLAIDEPPYRFDVVEVVLSESDPPAFNRIENAFQLTPDPPRAPLDAF